MKGDVFCPYIFESKIKWADPLIGVRACKKGGPKAKVSCALAIDALLLGPAFGVANDALEKVHGDQLWQCN